MALGHKNILLKSAKYYQYLFNNVSDRYIVNFRVFGLILITFKHF